MSDEIKGLGLGFIGVAIFSMTLPVTRMALSGGLAVVTVGIGRAVVAALVAAVILRVARQPVPPMRYWKRLIVAGLCLVIGFPLFMSIAMLSVPASHGGVVLGILPFATTLAAAMFCGERPSPGFWLVALVGSGAVVAFAVVEGGGGMQAAALWMLAAALSAGTGYALSGELSRVLGGWQVICWSLVGCVPFIVPPVVWVWPDIHWQAPWQTWTAFGYVALFSQLIGFFAWNRGMALGGVSRVAQVQLLQLFMTLAGSAVLLGEEIGTVTLIFAVCVVAAVALSRQMPVSRRDL